jgi:hypothetical protein
MTPGSWSSEITLPTHKVENLDTTAALQPLTLDGLQLPLRSIAQRPTRNKADRSLLENSTGQEIRV